MSREYCRVDDCPSYDFSDYEEQKGYYKPYGETEEPDYDPIDEEEMRERIKEVKTRLGVKKMKTYKVYMSETVEYSYDVVAENVEQAKDKIYSGDYDENTYNIIDSHGSQIDDVLEGVTE